jgi:hypothetical protein
MNTLNRKRWQLHSQLVQWWEIYLLHSLRRHPKQKRLPTGEHIGQLRLTLTASSSHPALQATLTYSCLCSNGSAPGLEYYKDTLPTNICQKSFALCITAHPDDATGQETCKTTILAKCGTLDIANFTAVASTTSVPTTSVASSTAISVASTTSAAPSTTTSKSAATFAASVGKDMGSVFVAAGLLGAFGYML